MGPPRLDPQDRTCHLHPRLLTTRELDNPPTDLNFLALRLDGVPALRRAGGRG
jgi:hypothetical protein